MGSYLSTRDIASRLGIHEETVRRWLRAGELRGIPLGRAGYRVTEEDLHHFLAQRGTEAHGEPPTAGESPHWPRMQRHAAQALAEAKDARRQAEAERERLVAALAHEQSARAGAEAAMQNLAGVFEAITDGIFIVDKDGRVPLINRAARVLLDVAPDAPGTYPTIPPFDLLDGHGDPLPRDRWPQEALFAGQAMHPGDALDLLLRTRDGRVRQLNITGAPLHDSEGTVTGAVVVCRDVTERRQMEQRTQQSLEALLTMAEEMARIPSQGAQSDADHEQGLAERLIGLIRSVLGVQRASLTIIDPATGMLRAGAVAGITPTEEQAWRERRPGAALRDYLTDPDLDAHLRSQGAVEVDFASAVASLDEVPFGIRTLLLVAMEIDGRMVGVLALDQGGAPYHFSDNEVTLAKAVGKLGAFVLERERLIRERAAALAEEEALRTANQRMDDFLSVASHELRTPMTTIKMSLQLISRRMARLDPIIAEAAPDFTPRLVEMREMLDRAEWQADRQTRLLGDLLDVTRIQAGKMTYRVETCDLMPIIRECIDGVRHLAPARSITFAGAEACLVLADPDRVAQVIMNYLTNALKYSEATSPVHVALVVEGAMVRFAVTDQGRGLSPDAQRHIWERFFRVAQTSAEGTSAEGLGLGLFICRTIITALGGQVGVQSTLGVGSTFWFTLPRAAAVPQPVTVAAGEGSEGAGD